MGDFFLSRNPRKVAKWNWQIFATLGHAKKLQKWPALLNFSTTFLASELDAFDMRPARRFCFYSQAVKLNEARMHFRLFNKAVNMLDSMLSLLCFLALVPSRIWEIGLRTEFEKKAIYFPLPSRPFRKWEFRCCCNSRINFWDGFSDFSRRGALLIKKFGSRCTYLTLNKIQYKEGTSAKTKAVSLWSL